MPAIWQSSLRLLLTEANLLVSLSFSTFRLGSVLFIATKDYKPRVSDVFEPLGIAPGEGFELARQRGPVQGQGASLRLRPFPSSQQTDQGSILGFPTRCFLLDRTEPTTKIGKFKDAYAQRTGASFCSALLLQLRLASRASR